MPVCTRLPAPLSLRFNVTCSAAWDNFDILFRMRHPFPPRLRLLLPPPTPASPPGRRSVAGVQVGEAEATGLAAGVRAAQARSDAVYLEQVRGRSWRDGGGGGGRVRVGVGVGIDCRLLFVIVAGLLDGG